MTDTVPAGGRAATPSHPWRAVNRVFHGRRRLGAASMLGLPLSFMLVVYVGSLLMLVLAALYALDPTTQKPSDHLTWDNLHQSFALWDADVRDQIWPFFRTVGVALLVTALCVLIALPAAFFVAKVAKKWMRRSLIVAMLLPLWAGYLVKGYAWKAIVAPATGNAFAAAGKGEGGFLDSMFGWTPGYGRVAVVLTEVYLWLPYMILPIYAGLERLPASLLDAAGDLGARAGRTFRDIVVPLLRPAIAAGSIFTFSLTLGDYIVPRIVNDGKELFLFGSVINNIYGAPHQPLAAAYTLWPLLTIILYLFAMRRAGAFENL